ncbi:unnamed protein product [[Actinomadura] parvosata subsp. kistnae]|nr:unnamed protein product [Actinomadura parvosata subsp. kistnae]
MPGQLAGTRRSQPSVRAHGGPGPRRGHRAARTAAPSTENRPAIRYVPSVR